MSACVACPIRADGGKVEDGLKFMALDDTKIYQGLTILTRSQVIPTRLGAVIAECVGRVSQNVYTSLHNTLSSVISCRQTSAPFLWPGRRLFAEILLL